MIYIIRRGDTDVVKIGFTGSGTAAQRVCNLQVGCPERLVLEASIPGDQRLEKRIHRHVANKHIRGEWFRLTKYDVKNLIYRMAGSVTEADHILAMIKAVHQRPEWMGGCSKKDCDVCGILDCPHLDPSHYSKNNCNSCSEPESLADFDLEDGEDPLGAYG